MNLHPQAIQFSAARRRRVARYGALYDIPTTARGHVASLEANGYLVLRQVLDTTLLAQLRLEADEAVSTGRLVPARVRKAFTEQVVSDQEREDLTRLAALGEENLARHESMVYVDDPLVCCPSAVPMLFSDAVLDIAAGYYGCPAALISPKIVRSYVNDLPESSVHRFHCDYQRVRFLKFFIYLSDVDNEEDGPFSFVAGSHRSKPRGWRHHHPLTWSAGEMMTHYGQDAIRLLTGRPGDLIVADTRGFHRGVKARSRPRTMLKVSTGLRPWRGTPARMPSVQMATLLPKQRAAADFLLG